MAAKPRNSNFILFISDFFCESPLLGAVNLQLLFKTRGDEIQRSGVAAKKEII
jgi:hypothetical protein